MFKKILIANRGAIACRIIRTLDEMGIDSVAVYHQDDASSLHVRNATEAYCLGNGSASDTYLNISTILNIAKTSGAEAIHPGYGFLSENPDFVAACEEAGVVFLGPTSEQMNMFGLKHTARELAENANVPLLPGTGLLDTLEDAQCEAASMGYPVMLKSTAGGGGIGMRLCENSDELADAFDAVKRLGENNFSHSGLFLEKFITCARHIEVQVVGDGAGNVLTLGERDCSAQRRNQKVMEETPAPNLDEITRSALQDTAQRLAASVNYRSAGTVEFILDETTQQFYFLEVNTRLQVEHGVTEMLFDVDIVRLMIEIGCDEFEESWVTARMSTPFGHAIQFRLYAEDPNKSFLPSTGLINQFALPDNVVMNRPEQREDGTIVRVDGWIESGVEVSPYFDPMLAKLMVHAGTREDALAGLTELTRETRLYGIESNIAYLSQLAQEDIVTNGEILTSSLNQFDYQPLTFDVLAAGTQTTIQDIPGREGYWHVGIPPSGPMDSLSFRLGNQLLDNNASCAGLEIIANGPSLRFNTAVNIVVAGAEIPITINGETASLNMELSIEKGDVLELGAVTGEGARAYVLFKGGLDCPKYLGSRSTFTLGKFGGHSGRALMGGDVIHLLNPEHTAPSGNERSMEPVDFAASKTLRVIYGPHGAPDFFTNQDIDAFFEAEWEVHFNSSRTGVRLIGPKPDWARADGGEAGLHPSNIHDNAYAVGTVDFTGDMPVILGPDGPSLGGFVCPATVIKADLWKLGQLKPGDKIRFQPVTFVDAEEAECHQILSVGQCLASELHLDSAPLSSPILKTIDKERYGEQVVYRPSGEDYLLVEYGPQALDIRVRFRVHALMLALEKMCIPAIKELTPGIRSLQVHYDNLRCSVSELIAILEIAEGEIGDISSLSVPSRIIHLPLSWNDPSIQKAMKKYDDVVRKNAPWNPDNIEFIRRINGLNSIEQVKEIVFNANYLVMGLGDVYLGAPVATPMDPRHRLVTTKYNPARTWTPENAVGIGGAYMCVYGMEGPGGYQLMGRTLQMWNRYRENNTFTQPWLLRFFDQIRFYPVSPEELTKIRQDFPLGKFDVRIEETTFSLAGYEALLEKEADAIAAFKQQQQHAFDAERQRWEESGDANFVSISDIKEETEDQLLDQGQFVVPSQLAGNVWRVLVNEGDTIEAGQPILIVESMKMEIEVTASQRGRVVRLSKQEGEQVQAGQPLLVMEQI
ncbi:urea carboxylase [Enterovibrio sp. ZSDZ35]|uniref:Urea carboxylase n=1 Tax=Enterovibrio qingdaonensis TaxID=2899818 RepID=A0ABT5QH47_9GAMM|nr:urea carboxylase [Enterovibrio sp. ZSDZ35]MDD1779671.1 urea carboxylase [Enterovibrio sp. ZSDZ35]